MTASQTTELGFDVAQRIARVSYVGWQAVAEGDPNFPGFALYNILSGDGLCAGSTVTVRSLEKQGYTVEVVK